MTLLSGGTVVDGANRPPRICEVLVRGDEILELGSIGPAADAETIDCSGLTITPGFIDVHSHSDHEVLRHLPNKILQGVTTEIVGNCGLSLFPSLAEHSATGETDDIFDGENIHRMASASAYFEALEQSRPLLNVAALTGHNSLRSVLPVRSRVMTEYETRRMEQMLTESLDAGSIGFSTGLNCMPGGFARFDELSRLCRLLNPFNAFYTTHMRDYKFKVVEAVDESIALAKASDVALQISHMQVVGQKNWDTALERIEQLPWMLIRIWLDPVR